MTYQGSILAPTKTSLHGVITRNTNNINCIILTVLCHWEENLNGCRRTRPLGRPRRRWDDNIKMDVSINGIARVDWSDLAQDMALVNTVINLGAP